MRHPFAGVIASEDKSADRQPEPVNTSRRGFFGLVAGTLGAVGLFALASSAEAQVTTLALGEEGGRRPGVTTRALGEEGGRRPGATTRALGEEGGRRRGWKK
jgi:hypothetical protein